MTVANLAIILVLTLSVASCISHEPISPVKRLLISGILKLYSEHKPLSDEELAGAFQLAPHDFRKNCDYNCKYQESLMNDSPRPDQAVTAFFMDAFSDPSIQGGWAGKQITIAFNDSGNYCLHGEEFGLATALKYSIAPAGYLAERGASVSWPARYVFKEPGGRNTITFDPGCVRSVRIVIHFSRPDPD